MSYSEKRRHFMMCAARAARAERELALAAERVELACQRLTRWTNAQSAAGAALLVDLAAAASDSQPPAGLQCRLPIAVCGDCGGAADGDHSQCSEESAALCGHADCGGFLDAWGVCRDCGLESRDERFEVRRPQSANLGTREDA